MTETVGVGGRVAVTTIIGTAAAWAEAQAEMNSEAMNNEQ
jgi:hypothetical protein